MNNRDLPQSDLPTIALLSPGWPPEAVANGVVSYTSVVARGLRDFGAPCEIVATRPADGRMEQFVHPVRIDTNSLKWRLLRRLDPDGWPQKAWSAAVLD